MPPFTMPEPGRLPGPRMGALFLLGMSSLAVIRRCRRILILPPAMHFPLAERGAELIVLRNAVLATAIMAGTVLLSLQKLNAFELTGAWTTSADKCGKVFARKGRANQVNFTNFSGAHGGGFIAEANRLRGSPTVA